MKQHIKMKKNREEDIENRGH